MSDEEKKKKPRYYRIKLHDLRSNPLRTIVLCYSVDCRWRSQDNQCMAYSIEIHGSERYGDANVWCNTYVYDEEKEEEDRRAHEEIAYYEGVRET